MAYSKTEIHETVYEKTHELMESHGLTRNSNLPLSLF